MEVENVKAKKSPLARAWLRVAESDQAERRVRWRIFRAKPNAEAAPRKGSGPGTVGPFYKETVRVVPEAV